MKTGVKVYKVVRRLGGEYRSAIIDRGPFSLTYRLHEMVVAPRNGILCFSTQAEAFDFMYRSCYISSAVVLECEGFEPVKFRARFATDMEDCRSTKRLPRATSAAWPCGTVAYRKVLPKKVVREKN